MDRQATAEISGEVAQFLAFTMTELRSFLNMFYEEEEREADKIRTKYGARTTNSIFVTLEKQNIILSIDATCNPFKVLGYQKETGICFEAKTGTRASLWRKYGCCLMTLTVIWDDYHSSKHTLQINM